MWEFPRSINTEKLPLIKYVGWNHYFYSLWISKEQQKGTKKYVMSIAITVLNDLIYHPAVKNKAIRRKNISFNVYAEIYLEIRIKKKFISRKVLFGRLTLPQGYRVAGLYAASC